MDDLSLSFLRIAAVVWGTFVLLLFYARRKGVSFTKSEKRTFFIVVSVLLAVSGGFAFFEDADFVFDCRKETRRCDYFHSTLSDRRVRLVRSYDLSGVDGAEIVSRRRSCGRYCRKTVYRIRFRGRENGFEMPKDFDFKDDAEHQASKAAAFLQTDKPLYRFQDTLPDDAGKDLIVIMGSVLSSALAFGSILTILMKLYKTDL